jgi:hypothetical protein
LGQSVSFNKQGLAKVDLPYLNITVGMQQYREQERRFLLGHNDLSSLLRWKSKEQEIMISYTDMNYLPLFLMFYEGVVQKRLTNFLAFVTDLNTYSVGLCRELNAIGTLPPQHSCLSPQGAQKTERQRRPIRGERLQPAEDPHDQLGTILWVQRFVL